MRGHTSQCPGGRAGAHPSLGGGWAPRCGGTPAPAQRYRAHVLDRLRRRVWGISGRLTASYVVVTFAVVVLVEALVLAYQAPGLVNNVQLQAQVGATAKILRGPAHR